MTVWMLWASFVTLLIAAAAASVERALGIVRRPVRPVWSAAAIGSVGLMAWSTRASAPPPSRPTSGGELQTAVADLLRELTAGVGPAPALLERTDDLVLLGWLTASALLLAVLVGGQWRLSRRARSWSAAVVDGHEVLVSESFGPALVGIFTPRIVVPRWALHLGPERLRMACLHEEEHRRGRDGLLLLGGALLVAAAPWNPGLWWIHARLRAAVEIDCDARVLQAGTRPVPYGALLLELSARALEAPPVVAAFARPRTNLERRMTMIVRERAHGGAWEWSRAAGAVAVGALLAVAACHAPAPTDVGASGVDGTPNTVSSSEHVALPELAGAPELGNSRGEAVGSLRLRDSQPHRVGEEESSGSVRLRELEPGDGHAVHLDREPATQLTGAGAPEPSAGHTVRLRGAVPGSGEPLIFVDGVRVVGRAVLEELSPDRVERIEVIKGPAAVGLYGSEAATGVIQIFMKEVSQPRN